MNVLISHRGNLNGRIAELENHPEYIENALKLGFDVEIDIWIENEKIFLGHDNPMYEIDFEFLKKNKEKLWIHCKNYDSILLLKETNLNFFWHQTDDLTLTSKNHIWVYPGKQPIKNSIAVLPEIFNDDLSECIGICSDYIKKYKK